MPLTGHGSSGLMRRPSPVFQGNPEVARWAEPCRGFLPGPGAWVRLAGQVLAWGATRGLVTNCLPQIPKPQAGVVRWPSSSHHIDTEGGPSRNRDVGLGLSVEGEECPEDFL